MVPIHLSRLGKHIHMNSKQLRRIARVLEDKNDNQEEEQEENEE